MRKWAIILAIAALAVAVLSAIALAQSKLPGVVIADVSADGCLSCHKMGADGTDRSLAKSVPASHAKFSAKMLADVKGCYSCHAKRADMAQLMHEAHLVGAENHFIKSYGGYCTHCHAVNATTGAVTLKGM